MDRLVYVAMSGAKEMLRAQTTNSYNLANVSTIGFRADLSAFQTQQVAGAGLASRAYATGSSVGPDLGVKASGGIRTLDDFRTMAAAGASRIGASASVKIVEAAAG